MSALNCLVTLQNEYLDSKNIQNIFLRYSRLKGMVKVRMMIIMMMMIMVIMMMMIMMKMIMMNIMVIMMMIMIKY